MRITTVSDFLRLEDIDLAEVTELVLEAVDLNTNVQKTPAVMAAVEEAGPHIYAVELQGVRLTTSMDKTVVEYKDLLSIVGAKLAAKCPKLRMLSLTNCSLGVLDVQTQRFFADLQQCRRLEVLHLPDNALWGMTRWENAYELFKGVRLTSLDLSSNSLFDSDLWDEVGEDTQDYLATWSRVLSVLLACNTLRTLNLGNNCVDRAVRSCSLEMTKLLIAMIVEFGTEVHLEGNDLSHLTASNLEGLRRTPSASAAAEGPTMVLSKDAVRRQLLALIKSEIQVQDELDFDVDLFRQLSCSSPEAEHLVERLVLDSPVLDSPVLEKPVLKMPALSGGDLKRSASMESFFPADTRTAVDPVVLQDRGLIERGDITRRHPGRRFVSVPSRPRRDAETSLLGLFAFSTDDISTISTVSSDVPRVSKKRNNAALESVEGASADGLENLSKVASFDRQAIASTL